MASTQYAAGFHFVVNAANQKSNGNKRKGFMKHVAKAQWRRRRPIPMHSWIDPTHKLSLADPEMALLTELYPSNPSPARLGGDFSATPLPPGVEPAMIQELVKLIDLDKEGVYPYEVCLRVHPVQRGWFPTMINDVCCLHSMMYSVRAFMNDSLCERQTRLVALHYDQTLQLLRTRIRAFQYGRQDPRLDDPTIMTIFTLISAAEITGDHETAQNHLDALLMIVNLTGGLRSLSTQNNLRVKVCRADLGLALRLGVPPRLMQDDIAWECFIADRGLIRCSHAPFEALISAFVGTLDSRLGNAWRDIHAFCCLSNLAYQTNRKFSPETYNEMMISIFYRLTHLQFQDDIIQEAIRIALLTFCTTLFLTRRYRKQPYEHLCELFDNSLLRLCRSTNDTVPQSIMLWLLVLYHMVLDKYLVPEAWKYLLVEKVIILVEADSWSMTHGILRSVMWVDFVHESPGRKAFTVMGQFLREMKIREP